MTGHAGRYGPCWPDRDSACHRPVGARDSSGVDGRDGPRAGVGKGGHARIGLVDENGTNPVLTAAMATHTGANTVGTMGR